MTNKTDDAKADKAEETSGSSRSKVLPCKCESEYQDQKYGKNQRVHSRGGKSGTYHWTCSICGARK